MENNSNQSFSKADVHICGLCQSRFTSIVQFIVHKKEGCSNKVENNIDSADSSPQFQSTSSCVDVRQCDDNNVDNNKTLTSPSTSASNSKNSSKTMQPCPKKTSTGSKSKNFGCTYEGCTYASAYRKDLQRHLRVHTGEKPYSCKFCDKSFRRLDKLNIHEMAHDGKKPYKCNLCSYATNESGSLKKHERIHTDERPFKCQMCPYASRNSSQLVVHLRTHTGDAPFQCPECTARFKINSDLKRHLRMHTGEKPFSCAMCEYKCSIKSNLTTHVRLNHSVDNARKCSICEFRCTSRRDLREHLKTHNARQSGKKAQNSATSRSVQTTEFPSKQQEKVLEHTKEEEKLQKKGNRRGRPGGTWPFSSAPSSHSGDSSVSSTVCQRNFRCHLCDSAFVRLDSLRCHLRCHQQQQQQGPQALEHSVAPNCQGQVIEQAMKQSGIWASSGNGQQQQPEVLATTSYTQEAPAQLLYQIVPTTIVSLSGEGAQQIFFPVEATSGSGVMFQPEVIAQGYTSV